MTVSPRTLRTVASVLAALLLAGCSAAAEQDGPTFVLPDGDTVTCQEHQPSPPSAAYAGDASADTVAMLDLLQYWTANGDKPYCDGEPPTENDVLWSQTVDRLQGRPSEPQG